MVKVLLLPGIALLVLYMMFHSPHYTWRQKLIVQVSTPRGLIEGAAITQVDLYDSASVAFQTPESRGGTSTYRGEAVAVEIAPGRVLFVLLENEYGYGGPNRWPRDIWGQPRLQIGEFAVRVLEQKGKAPAPLPQKAWPLMVTFDDLSRPETVHLVTGKDLSAWFGPGVQLEGLTLQITDEPMTVGRIVALLPWLIPVGTERPLVAAPPADRVSVTAFLSLDHWSLK